MKVESGTDHIILKSMEFVKKHFDDKVSKLRVYHNYNHTLDVYNACLELAEDAKLNDEEKEILLLSALFHDTGFSVGKENHEKYSADIAKTFLEAHNYDEKKLKQVLGCIAATRVKEEPKNRLQRLIKDADLSGLSGKSYMKHAKLIRKELNNFNDEKISKSEWNKTNVNFLKNTQYFSESGKKLYGPGKQENLKSLESMLEKKKEKNTKLLTIANSKSAQTQFKTALRNHIDLSAIADNKANIMLSVNALIITVATPILAETIIDIPNMLYPTISLLIVSVTSMVFATLATRPIKMQGLTNLDAVREKRSNLFFFGNFYKMKFEEYETGIKEVVAQDDVLNNSITRDLFYLGKALGAKYRNLRWCYNIFMYGIILTVLVFVVTLILQNKVV